MKRIKIFLLLIICFFVQFCNEEEYPIKLGGKYFLSDDSNGLPIITDTRSVTIINPQIVAWNFDSIFIIAKQKPYHSTHDSLRIKHPKTSLTYRERLYDKIEIYHYWIIDKRKDLDSYYDEKTRRRIYTNAVEGPFTHEQYWERRRFLNVPDSLQLREAEKISFDSPIHYLFYKWTNKPRENVVE